MNGCKSNGPATASGKERSSMNATRLGIRARRVLLDGERIEDYDQEAAVWVQGLDPQTDAEAEVVLDVVDVRVRLGRLERAVRVKTEAQ